MGKPKGTYIAREGCKYLGTKYAEMDCQAFVEKALGDVGLYRNLSGSNAWYREMSWTGTPEECRRRFGKIPVGAFLFILKDDGGEPGKYKSDGIGNASHIGIYSSMSGWEMCQIGGAGVECNHGDGAIHSSSSRGMVCTSNFKGKSINGGWNRVGLWNAIDYGIDIDGNGKQQQGGDMENVTKRSGTVSVGAGKCVKLRNSASTESRLYYDIPHGSAIEVSIEGDEWSYGSAVDNKGQLRSGWMMSKFIVYGDGNGTAESGEKNVVIRMSEEVARDIMEQIMKQIGVG